MGEILQSKLTFSRHQNLSRMNSVVKPDNQLMYSTDDMLFSF